ncbi:sigma factor [Streptomyces sp. NPDC048484]|uniref:sigma factor n=1 Tax=Streptomyces sp. NPDC048484 TaxID=3155146 RepID=UPI003422FDBF
MSAIEQQFSDIYREHYKRLVTWVYWKLPVGRQHMAEDFTQEAFQSLWDYLPKSGAPEYPLALLKRMAGHKMADFYVRRQNDSDVVAFDPAESSAAVAAAASGHRYVEGDPELSLLAGALYEAMGRMQDASVQWRRLHALTGKMRPLGEPYPDVPKRASRKLKQEAVREQAYRGRDEALAELQMACGEVGSLRAELERLGGRNWKSSTGWPPPSRIDHGTHRTTLDNPDVRECQYGHPLTIDTTGFSANGERSCRACGNDVQKRYAAKKATA